MKILRVFEIRWILFFWGWSANSLITYLNTKDFWKILGKLSLNVYLWISWELSFENSATPVLYPSQKKIIKKFSSNFSLFGKHITFLVLLVFFLLIWHISCQVSLKNSLMLNSNIMCCIMKKKIRWMKGGNFRGNNTLIY